MLKLIRSRKLRTFVSVMLIMVMTFNIAPMSGIAATVSDLSAEDGGGAAAPATPAAPETPAASETPAVTPAPEPEPKPEPKPETEPQPAPTETPAVNNNDTTTGGGDANPSDSAEPEAPAIYTVKFVNFDNSVVKEVKVEAEKTYGQLKSLTNSLPDREGYTFTKWVNVADNSEFKATTLVTNNLTVKAVYTANSTGEDKEEPTEDSEADPNANDEGDATNENDNNSPDNNKEQANNPDSDRLDNNGGEDEADAPAKDSLNNLIPLTTFLATDFFNQQVMSADTTLLSPLAFDANGQTIELEVGATRRLEQNNKGNWASRDTSIATVSPTNNSRSTVVTARGEGETTITYTRGNSTVIYNIKVSAAQATAVTIMGNNTVNVNNTLQLRARVSPDRADQTVTWESSDSAIATVSAQGEARGISSGQATITATAANGVSNTLLINVIPNITGLRIEGPREVSVGETIGLQVYQIEDNDHETLVDNARWSSDKPTVATVASNGRVTGIKGGSAKITATVDGRTAEYIITVKAYTVSLFSNYPEDGKKIVYDGGNVGKTVDAEDTYAVYQLGAQENNFTIPDAGFNLINYDFVGWQDSETGREYSPGANLPVNKNITLNALWQEKETEPQAVKVSVTYSYDGATRIKEVNGYLNADGTITFQLHKNQELGFKIGDNGTHIWGWSVGGTEIAAGGVCTTSSYSGPSDNYYYVSATAIADATKNFAQFYVLKRELSNPQNITSNGNYYFVGMGEVRDPGRQTIDYINSGFLNVDEYIISSPSAASIANVTGLSFGAAENVRWYKIQKTDNGWHVDGMVYEVGLYYNVTYHDSTGSDILKREAIADGSGYNLLTSAPANSLITKPSENSDFIGWSTSPNGGGTLITNSNAQVIISNDIDLYPVFKDFYSVTYAKGEHGNITPPSGAVPDASGNLVYAGLSQGTDTPAYNGGNGPAVVADSGWTFTGWQPTISSTVSDSVTYTAQYEQSAHKITYKIEGDYFANAKYEVIENVAYGTELSLIKDDMTQEGYTFSGWEGLPKTMPDSDVTVVGSYSKDTYTVTYMVDGEQYGDVDSYEYGAKVDSLRAAPEKEGYTFSGWNVKELPATMPANDIVVEGSFKVNTYTVTYKVDGEQYGDVDSYEYGAEVTPLRAAPEKEGYTFSGWSEKALPATMPANDIVVEGSFKVNTYTVTYMVDGEQYGDVDSYEYGAKVSPLRTAPEKEGYEFSGWSVKELPATMPANDIVVEGSFKVNSHTITYKVKGDYFANAKYEVIEDVAYGTELKLIKDDMSKEGYTFSGWEGLPNTMPDSDVTVLGSYTKNTHTITYKVEGDYFANAEYEVIENVAYGTELSLIEDDMTQEGYTFSGWEGLPKTMPDSDVTVVGSYTKNAHTITYKIEGDYFANAEYEVIENVAYGTELSLIKDDMTQEGYTFSGWEGLPKTMPDSNVTVVGSYSKDTYTVTYMVDGKTYGDVDSYEYGAEVTPLRAAPEKEGYEFSGWSVKELPAKMPAENIVVEGSFKVNTYTVTYKVDGKTYGDVDSYEFGAKVDSLRAAPEKEGYEFSGWSVKELPAKMPAENIVVEGSFQINTYTVTYKVDGKTYGDVDSYEYGAEVTPLRAAPEKEGYEFSGWSVKELPAKMPAENIVVEGSFKVNTYTVTYKVDGKTYGDVDSYEYGAKVDSLRAAPEKEGYTFSGWNVKELPATMPANDIVVEGSFKVNTYTVTYKVDGEQYGDVDSYEYGAEVTPLRAAPEKEGHEFSGWSVKELPAKMPAENIVVEGSFKINTYTVTYKVDGETYGEVDSYEYGAKVDSLRAAPEKEGYTFSGWSVKELPAKMPAENIVVEGSFKVNTYTVTYKVDGEQYGDVDSYEYGAEVTPLRTAPEKEGYTFSGWNVKELPAKMPAENIVVEGSFKINTYTVTYKVDGEQYGDVDSYEYGADVKALRKDPAKEGYTFSGWSEKALPATMPANDIVVEGNFKVNTYTVTYMVDGEQYGEVDSYEYGVEVTPLRAAPEKEGYTFSGWSVKELPATMPANDMVVEGSFQVNSYDLTVTYQDDSGAELLPPYRDTVEYGKDYSVNSPEVPGYTADVTVVAGKMGTEAVTVVVTYAKNMVDITYTVEYRLGEEEVLADSQSFTVTVWELEPTFIVDSVAVRNYADYTFDRYSSALPVSVTAGSVIVVYYTANPADIPVTPVDPVDPPAPPNPPAPTGPATPTGPVATPTAPALATTPTGTTVTTTVTPLASLDNEEILAPVDNDTTTIADPKTPLAPQGHWALLNLILAICCAVAMLLLLIGYVFGRKRDDEDEEVAEAAAAADETEEETLKRKGIWRLLSIIPGLGSIIVFILTENMTLPMVFVDRWTLLMVVIALVQLIVVLMSKKKRVTPDEEEETVMN